MRSLKAMYFLVFAVGGSVQPALSLYFQARGLSKLQIGFVQAVSSIAVILSPVLLTLLADSRLDARRIMASALLLAAAMLGVLHLVSGVTPILLIWTLHLIAYVPL